MIIEAKSKLDVLQELKKYMQPGSLNDELDRNGLYKEPKIKIHWSEAVDKEIFKQGEIITFSEANIRFRIAEIEIRMLKEIADINKISFTEKNVIDISKQMSSEDYIKEFKFFNITKYLDLEDGSKINKGTEFLIEGLTKGYVENEKYELHFSVDENNQYTTENGDGYFFTSDQIQEFSEPTEHSISRFKEANQYYPYVKVRFDLMVSPDKFIGMKYNIGDGYAEDIIDFCNREIKDVVKYEDLLDKIGRTEINAVAIDNKFNINRKAGVFILDSNDEIKLIAGISEKTYEGFQVRYKAVCGITDVRLNPDKDRATNLTVNLETKYKLKKEDIKSIIGNVKSETMNKILKHKNLFQSKNLIKEYKSSLEVSLENKLSDGLDFSMKR